MADSLTAFENENANCTKYEQQRNARKKALHDAMERTLIAAGFSEVAALQSVFSGDQGAVGGDAAIGFRCRGHRKGAPPRTLFLRRMLRRLIDVQAQALATIAARRASKEVAESFCSWTPRKRKTAMKSRKLASKRKELQSSNANADASQQESQEPTLECIEVEDKDEQVQPGLQNQSTEDVDGIEDLRQLQGNQTIPRPKLGGYRIPPLDRRLPRHYEDEFRFPYDAPGGPSSRGYFRRPWLPPTYESRWDYNSRAGDYRGRGRSFDGR